MLTTSTRLLTLLALLQSRTLWTGAELSARLEVSERTLRKDVERLRELGYPVSSGRGPAGGYRFGEQGRLPPLLLDEDEAVAIAVGLGSAREIRGLTQASDLAMTKLEQVLPERLRRRVAALRDSTETGPMNTATNVAPPPVDPAVLSELAAAVRDRVGVRFFYTGDERLEVDPYRLVSWQQRWYLVGRERHSRTWQSYRVDWMRLRTPGGARFVPEPLDGEDYTSFVLRQVASTGWAVHARIMVDAPAAEVLARINPTVGVVETVDETHSVLVTGGDSLEVVAVWIGMLGLPFHVTEPPELVEHLRALAVRYAGSVDAPTPD